MSTAPAGLPPSTTPASDAHSLSDNTLASNSPPSEGGAGGVASNQRLTTPEDAPQRWSRPFRAIVSLWLVYHFLAVVVAPSSVPPSSPLVRDSFEYFGPYLQALYLNHGYHYFAPEPGPWSTLLGWSVEREDGSRRDGRIPHRDIQPRLLYHRHFMLTEFLAAPWPPEELALWHRSYARHLCRRYDGERVSLSRIRHLLPTMQAVREGAALDDPESYTEEPLGVFECDEL